MAWLEQLADARRDAGKELAGAVLALKNSVDANTDKVLSVLHALLAKRG